MPLPDFALKKLEFEKIRKVLAGYLSTSAGEQYVSELEPVTERTGMDRQLKETAEMMLLLDASESPPLQTLYNISDALSKARIERFVMDGRSLAQIGRWAESARLLRTFFDRHNETVPNLWDVAQHLAPVRELEKQIRQIVDEKGEINSNASPELSRISRRIVTQKEAARSILQRLLHKGQEAGMTAGEEATLRGGRMVIPVRAEYKRKIKGFIHDTSATGQTVYIEPVEVFEKNNEIRELESAWKREVELLLRELTRMVGDHIDELNRNVLVIGHIDACYAATRLGMRWNGTIPEITDAGTVILKECRNPLLILKFNRFEEAVRGVVPLNLEMDQKEQGIIITGPNAGGKSVTLKTFGLAIVLAQCGIPIPAQEGARLPCVRGLYIDMGDEQSIDNDLSTFSSRLTWMKDVITGATSQSWVLIDEAGSGTDPDEGTALVTSFLELISGNGIRSIVTTHHGALKIFAHETPGWSNASMEFDRNSLSPTYRFQKGIPGSSYAFEIADRLQVPAELTQRAREWVGSGKNRLESLIISLEQESQQLQKQRSETDRQKESLDRDREELDKRLARIREERDAIREQAESEADKLLSNANRKIEEAIRAASDKNKEELRVKREEVDHLGATLQNRQKRHKKQRKPSEKALSPPKTGDAVRLIDSNTIGELVSVSGNKAMVLVKGLRISTRVDNLVRSEQKTITRPVKGYKLTTSDGNDAPQPFARSLDLRGKRGDEAIREVTRYVDEGLSRGMEQLTIIHGRGDGILRKLVHEHLKSRRDVKHFETAPIEEGGDGCTYVFL